jgi:DNA topoisomerase-2
LLRVPGFLLEFITPIVKATKGRQEIAFYTIPEYEKWKADNEDGRGWNIKYYKVFYLICHLFLTIYIGFGY